MTAYSETELYNCQANSQAKKLFEQQEISDDSFRKIRETYPCKFYSPPFFISLTLGLVTAIAVLFGGLLLGLLSENITFLCLFMIFISYVALESMVRLKKYYNAG